MAVIGKAIAETIHAEQNAHTFVKSFVKFALMLDEHCCIFPVYFMKYFMHIYKVNTALHKSIQYFS